MQVINEESNVVQMIDGEKKYVRSRSNQSIKLQTKLIELHKPKQDTKQEGEENLECLVCPSGTSAIYLTLNNLLSRYRNEKTKKNLICGNELYFQTTKTIEYLQEIHNFKLSTFDVKDSQKLTSLLKECENDDLVIVFVESASSPSGDIFDFNLIKQMKSEQMEKQKIHFVVDNTWLSSIIFNPFDYGADLVVTSLTNYYSASTNIAGAILGFPKLMKEMGKDFMMQGISVSPMLCESILQKVSTIEERLKKTSEITKKVALHLSEKFFVRHCSLDKDVSHSKSVDFYKNGLVPGVLTFVVDLDVQNTTRWLKSFDFVQFDSSYGSSKTKLDIHPKKIGDDKTLCRLSIGYSDSSEKLIDQFEKNSISSFKMK